MKNTAPTKSVTTIEWLLGEIDRFLTINAMENDGCVFGWYVMRDRSLVSRLREGGDVTTRKLEAILEFMQNPVTKDHRSGKTKRLDLQPLTITRRELP